MSSLPKSTAPAAFVKPLLTYDNLYRAKRVGTLVYWLREMTGAERVEAAEICAAHSRPSVSEWLRIFGELMDREAYEAQRRAVEPAPATPTEAAVCAARTEALGFRWDGSRAELSAYVAELRKAVA